jgi:ribonuclease HIII
MVVFEKVKKSQLEKLIPEGFCKLEPKTIYESFRCSANGVTLILYSSGKLFLQGKQVEDVAKILRKKQIGKEIKPITFRKQTGWMIGTDESLKGDTFGGLVVAAVKADNTIRKKLLEMGVQDSKKLKDMEILDLAQQLKKFVSCQVKSLLPEEYNRAEGQTQLLNKLHHDTAKYLGNGTHVVDKYPGCNVGDIQETKAESKYLEVAAASILARAAALKQLDYLSREAGFTLPKGSTHVSLALHELKEKNLPFNKFVKLHFNNVKEYL